MKKYGRWIFGVFFFLSSTCLFYRQSITYGGLYASDLPAHIEIARSGNGYSLLYFLMDLMLKTFKDRTALAAVACLGGVLIAGTYACGCRYLIRNFSIGCVNAGFISGILITLCCIYIPVVKPDFYTGGLITQPWHNITYIGMRFFALLTMTVFLSIVDNLTDIRLCDWAKITIFLLVSTSIKPNFFIMFAPALGILLLQDMFHKKISAKDFIRAGGVLIPSLCMIAWQAKVLYGSQSGSGIIITVTESAFFKDGGWGCFAKVTGSLAFPIIVLFIHHREMDRRSGFICVMYFISLIQAVFFEEKGARAGNGNFWWGCMFGGYMLFAWCIPRFILDCADGIKNKSKAGGYILSCGVLLGGHILSGIVYFVKCLSGANYFC